MTNWSEVRVRSRERVTFPSRRGQVCFTSSSCPPEHCPVRRLSPSLPGNVRYVGHPLLYNLKWAQYPVRRLPPSLTEEVKLIGCPEVSTVSSQDSLTFPTWRGQVSFLPLLDHLSTVSSQDSLTFPTWRGQVSFLPLLDHLKWGQYLVRRLSPSLPEVVKYVFLLSLTTWSEVSVQSGCCHLHYLKRSSMLVLLCLTSWSEVSVQSGRQSPFLPEEVRYVGRSLIDFLKWGQCPVRRLSPSLPEEVKYVGPPRLDHLKCGQYLIRRLSPSLPEEVKYVGPSRLDHLKRVSIQSGGSHVSYLKMSSMLVLLSLTTWREVSILSRGSHLSYLKRSVRFSSSPWPPEVMSVSSHGGSHLSYLKRSSMFFLFSLTTWSELSVQLESCHLRYPRYLKRSSMLVLLALTTWTEASFQSAGSGLLFTAAACLSTFSAYWKIQLRLFNPVRQLFYNKMHVPNVKKCWITYLFKFISGQQPP